jgi:hypothetical protein
VKEVLTGLGAGCEFVGILLVAAPELFPRAVSVWRSARERAGAMRSKLLRLLGRPRHITMEAEAGGVSVMGSGVEGLISKDRNASLEEKVAYLLDRDKQTQKQLSALNRALAAAKEESRRDLRVAVSELRAFVADRLERERDVHIHVRLYGIVLLLIGVPLLAVANIA